MMNNALNGLRQIASSFTGPDTYVHGIRNLSRVLLRELPAAEMYSVLRLAYNQVGLFDELSRLNFNRDGWAPAMKAVYCPVNRSVEFFGNRVLSGRLEIKADNEAIVPAIEQVWAWSNLDNLKTTLSRCLARDGDLVLKVTQNEARNRVYLQQIDPAHAVDVDVDERQNVVYIRLEIPMSERDANGKLTNYLNVECWSKELGTFRRWRVMDQRLLVSVTDDLSRFGTPDEELSLEEMGLNGWIPFCWAQFKSIGELRGVAAVTPAWDKIVNLSLMASRLHSLLYRSNNAVWAIQSAGRDPSGRLIPPPAVGSASQNDNETVTMGDDVLMRLPAGWELSSMVPNINYSDALAILQDQMAEIEKDLPELAYARLREMGTLSGYAVRLLLGDAIDRALEARANLESVLVRANQMALTIGANAGLFPDLGGTYESGAFEHEFKARDIVALSEVETQQAELTRAQGFQAWVSAGLPVGEALVRVGYTEDRAAELVVSQADALGGDSGVQ